LLVDPGWSAAVDDALPTGFPVDGALLRPALLAGMRSQQTPGCLDARCSTILIRQAGEQPRLLTDREDGTVVRCGRTRECPCLGLRPHPPVAAALSRRCVQQAVVF
jgi:hypothetical protein